MSLPPALSAWLAPGLLPVWAQIVLLVLVVLFGCAMLMVPFTVLGLKGRLDLLEAQLDDIHAELRLLSMRLGDPEPAARVGREGERAHEASGEWAIGRTEPRLDAPRQTDRVNAGQR